jgi:cell division protease FtsH
MAIDPWLPSGFRLEEGGTSRRALFEGPGWQVYETSSGGRALVVRTALLQRWTEAGLLDHVAPRHVSFGGEQFALFESSADQVVCPVVESRGPSDKAEAMSFAIALHETRRITRDAPLHDALYVERISRLLPTWSLAPALSDDVVLGMWLTGGVRVSATSFRRLVSLVGRLTTPELKSVLEAAGFVVGDTVPGADAALVNAGAEGDEEQPKADPTGSPSRQPFTLPGRAELETFFREHVIDLIENEGRYAALGINFPAPVALYGPPGSGKTFAIERLIEYLGWPSFSVDSSTIGSPYIHETGRKIAKVFDDAIKASPSVIVIDEMESFLSDRQAGGGQGLHHVEEVAEFLRRIPEAVENRVLVIGMTNRIEMIDPAILRRGRFDHVIEVGMPGEPEIRSLLSSVLSRIPGGSAVDIAGLAVKLVGRPLSDAAFVVREGARLAAKRGRDTIDLRSVEAALESAPSRSKEDAKPATIGFRTP